MIIGKRLTCCSMLALATFQSMYPAILLVPASVYLAQADKGKSLDDKKPLKASSFIRTVIVFLAALILLIHISSQLAGGWDFLQATYGFMYVYLNHCRSRRALTVLQCSRAPTAKQVKGFYWCFHGSPTLLPWFFSLYSSAWSRKDVKAKLTAALYKKIWHPPLPLKSGEAHNFTISSQWWWDVDFSSHHL